MKSKQETSLEVSKVIGRVCSRGVSTQVIEIPRTHSDWAALVGDGLVGHFLRSEPILLLWARQKMQP